MSVRLDPETGEEDRFALPLTQKLIGDALGLTPVHVNRTIQHLRNDGLVEIANRTMTLLDVSRLRQLGGFDPRYLHIDPPAVAQPTQP